MNELFAACGLCEKQINFEYNQKPLYQKLLLAFFSVLTNQILAAKLT